MAFRNIESSRLLLKINGANGIFRLNFQNLMAEIALKAPPRTQAKLNNCSQIANEWDQKEITQKSFKSPAPISLENSRCSIARIKVTASRILRVDTSIVWRLQISVNPAKIRKCLLRINLYLMSVIEIIQKKR